jgi:deoxyribonuclease-4
LIPELLQLKESKIIDYIELSVIPNTQVAPFSELAGDYILHIPQEKFGINLADKLQTESNSNILNLCFQWADILNAKFLIIHPGFGEEETVLKNLEEINDDRIILENMPKVGINQEKMIGFSPKSMVKLMGSKFGFCFDINHAIKAATSLRVDYKEFLPSFLSLNPKIIHISDGRSRLEIDEHLNIGKGDFDWDFILQQILESNCDWVTLETPHIDSLSTNVEEIQFLHRMFSKF